MLERLMMECCEMEWTDERTENLIRWWGEGLSAREIALRMGGITRNSVIGKIRRLGVPQREQDKRKNPRGVRSYKRVKPSRPAPIHDQISEPVALERDPEPEHVIQPEPANTHTDARYGPCGLLDLRHDTCRWPIGEPGSGNFYFCGQRCPATNPYCAAHTKRAKASAKTPAHIPTRRFEPRKRSRFSLGAI